MCLLSFLDDAEGLGSDVGGISGRIISADPYRRVLGVFGNVHIGRHAKVRHRIQAREVTANTSLVDSSTRKAIRQIEYQGRAKGLGQVDGKQVIVFLDRSSRTGIGSITKTVEAVAVISAFRVLGAQQTALAEAMVNLDVELVLRIAVGS